MYYVGFLCTFSLIFANFYVEVFVCVFKKKNNFYPNVTFCSEMCQLSQVMLNMTGLCIQVI